MSLIVHCPKCHSAVTVGPEHAAKRVQCPSCLKPFLAPSNLGQAGSSAEDEDWLTLEDPVEIQQADLALDDSSPEDSAFEADDFFGEDPFVDESDASAADAYAGDEDDDDVKGDDDDENPFVDDDSDPSDLFGDFPPLEDQPAAANAPAAKAATVDPEQEFRVTCPVCGSVMYAKAKQTGSQIKCGDCFTEIRVPKPPKQTKPPKRDENAETFQFAESGAKERPADPFQRSAQELLREAETDPEEKERVDDDDIPSVAGWIKSVFGIFLDPGVVIHFVGLSLLLGVPAALTFAYPVLAIGLVPLVIISVTLSVACGFAILFSVSNEHDAIEDWPTVDPTNWFESMWLVLAATALAVAPAYVITTLFSAPVLIKIGLIMFAVYSAFPIILLSMLDMQSVTSPFSVDVSKSITRCQEDWGAFYFSSGLLFAGLFAYFLLVPKTPVTVGIGVSLSIATVFIYFAMLGRLALAIGNEVDLPALDQEEEDEED